MRVIALHLGNDRLLELHPYVSVVQRLDVHDHRLVVDALGRLTSNRVPPLSGQLELNGVLLDLDAANVELLDLTSNPVTAVVRRDDLPGAALSAEGRTLRARRQLLEELDGRLEQLRREAERAEQARASAVDALDRARRTRAQAASDATSRLAGLDELATRIDELAEHRRRLHEQLVGARRAAEAASAQRTRVESEAAPVRLARRRVVDDATRIAARLDEARTRLDPLAAAAAQTAREVLATLELEAAARADAAAHRVAPAAETTAAREAEIAARMDELHDLLRVLVPADPAPVRDALTLLQRLDEQELVASPAAFALADELEKVESRLSEVGDAPSADGTRVAAARVRLDEARAALVEAEQAARVPELDRSDVDELDHAHAAVLDALERSESRLGGARAKRKLDEARAAEREVLDRLGFATYADYLMGSSILNIDPETEARLDEARATLADAEDEWRELQLALDADLERGTLLDRRRELREQARSMLGQVSHIADLAAALRALRVPAVSGQEAALRLRAALDAVGLPVADEDLHGDDLIHLAETWLVEDKRSAERRTEVVAELDRLAAEHAALEAQTVAPPAEVDDVSLEEVEQRLATARRDLADAERRVSEHRAAEHDVAELEQQLAAAVDAERAAAIEADAAEAQLEAAAAAERAAVEQLSQLEADVAAAAASEEAAAGELRRLEPGHAAVPEPALDADERTHQMQLEELTARADEAAAAVAHAEAERASVAAEIDQLERALQSSDAGDVPVADELEWYLLSRLAAQRSVSFAGSVPLVIDEAFDGLDAGEVGRLLDRIERMAAAVQIVVISDAPAVAHWAELAGFERAAVVRPERVAAAPT